jgi:hypothetical protein
MSTPYASAPTRYDVFEPGDQTALVAIDVPDLEKDVADQIADLGYKIHTGISTEDLLFKMRAHPYDIVVIEENFGGTKLQVNPLLAETISMSASQRQQQVVVLIGPSMRTADESQAFQYSVDVVVGTNDLRNLRPILRRCVMRAKEFYGRYVEAIAAAETR